MLNVGGEIDGACGDRDVSLGRDLRSVRGLESPTAPARSAGFVVSWE